MGFLDKLMGRTKKADDDMTGHSSMGHEGAGQDQHEEPAEEQGDQAAQAGAEQDQPS